MFCIALNPLSQLLNKSGYGYRLKSKRMVNHLIYMDDIKLYAKSENQIDSLIRTVQTFSDDIGMKFGFEKCARLITKRGKITKTEGLKLENGTINDANCEDGYKYLGIQQLQGNMLDNVKRSITTNYKARLRQVLKSKLNGWNKIQAMNTFAVPVVSYAGEIIKWTDDEMKTSTAQHGK